MSHRSSSIADALLRAPRAVAPLLATSLLMSLAPGCGGRTPLSDYRDGGPDTAVACDRDTDGYSDRACGGDDCNDLNGTIHPGAAEFCFDGVDNDCDGLLDCDDSSCAGLTECGGSCVPSREVCFDGADNDCDRRFDCDDPDCVGDPSCGTCRPGPELDCINGVDDDCNGLIDCADPACGPVPDCGACVPEPERCFDGVDNDCNGLLDCDDPSCVMEPACGACTPSPERCGNGLDDDCDGAPDCADSDCASTPACSSRTCPTGNLGMRLGDALATGSTAGARDDFRGGCGDGGPERTFRWRAPHAGNFVFDTAGSRFDTVLYLMNGCGGALVPGACNDDATSTQARLSWRLEAGQSVIVVVDGFGGGTGSFVLSIREAPNAERGPACFNGVDDDGDGPIDCDDPDCAGEPGCGMTCFPEVCGNGRDDDCDGAIDCDDRDCAGDPSCGMTCSPEDCGNGRDDDCDGLVDCADRDCAADPRCGMCVPTRERCANGADDDCDGLVDCADPDCARARVCGPTMDRELGVAACTNGRDDDGDGRVDCDDPDCSPFGPPPMNECCNGRDDNADGQIDEFTCRCFDDATCAGVGSLEQTCWTSTFHVCGARCDFYGGDSLCTEFFGPGWSCVGTQCVPPAGGTGGSGGGPPPPAP